MKINIEYWNSLTRNQDYYADMDERLFPMLQRAGIHSFTYEDKKHRLRCDELKYIPKGKKRPVRSLPCLVFDNDGNITWKLMFKPNTFDKETTEAFMNLATETIGKLIIEGIIITEE